MDDPSLRRAIYHMVLFFLVTMLPGYLGYNFFYNIDPKL